jgi:hypothetical protein
VYRYFQLFAIGAALVVPVVASAQDRDHAMESRKYEDKAHHDSHEWNSNEDTAYRRYLQEHHRKYHEFAKAKKSEQSDYWNWRHSHPDNDHR